MDVLPKNCTFCFKGYMYLGLLHRGVKIVLKRETMQSNGVK